MSALPGVGVFGCNSKSGYLVNCLIRNGFEVTAVWSDCLAEAREFATRFKINFHTDKVDVLLLKKEVQLILINCHQNHYVQIVSEAFRIGKHVLCDWPSNLSVCELNKMSEAASHYPSLISHFQFPLRFLPQFSLIRKLIQEHYIGDITLINVNINGRTLIELDNIEQLINNQLNCIHCLRENKKLDSIETEQSSSEEPSSFEKTDESSIEFVDPNKIHISKAKQQQQFKENNSHKSTHSDQTHQAHSQLSIQNKSIKNDQPTKNVNKLPICLIKRLGISSHENKKYKEIMQEGGILNNLGPHVIDIISYVTNLKVKKCSGILRTFNTSPFLNELSLIKRINVDDFCTFQLQMDNISSTSFSSRTQQQHSSTINRTAVTSNHNHKSSVDKCSNNEKRSKSISKSNIKVKELANNKPIAIVTLNDHLETLDKSYEIVIAGEFCYLRLKDGNLFGKQYEQNNNTDDSTNLESLEEEKAFFLVKNNLKLDSYCIKHQDQEITKLIISNRQLFRPFKSGIENLVESMKSAFDNESNNPKLKTVINCQNNLMNGDNKSKSIESIKNEQINGQSNLLKENKMQNGQTNGHSTIVKINNERNLVQPLKSIQINNKTSSEKPIINSTDKMVKTNGLSSNGPGLIIQQQATELTNGDHQSNGNSNKLTNGHEDSKQLLTNGTSKSVTENDVIMSNGDQSKVMITSNKVETENIEVDKVKQAMKHQTTKNESVKDAIKNVTTTKKVDEDRCCDNLQRIKDAMCMASSFEDGQYVKSVIEAIRLSSIKCEWIHPQSYSTNKK